MEKLVDRLKDVLENNYFEKDKDGSYFLEITDFPEKASPMLNRRG